MMFSRNWITASVTIMSGVLIWIVSSIVMYYDKVPYIALIVPFTNFLLGTSTIPIMLYITEKWRRYNFYLQYCTNKVINFII